MSAIVFEVPTALKRLVRLTMQYFYSVEHLEFIDMLIRNPCMKEDDLLQKKQLESVIAQLKNDKFVKVRERMETGLDGKATRQNYYYINYEMFVDALKYKLDHMRRKIETEERDSTSRASFKCTACEKKFTDLEAGQLINFMTGEFRCSFCDASVVEDKSALFGSRLVLARFNEQIEPLYNLLREIEDIKLAPEILEPEPTDMTQIKRDASGNKVSSDSRQADNKNIQEKKEQPIWMTESTIKTDSKDASEYAWGKDRIINPSMDFGIAHTKQDDIMEALLAHERKDVNEAKLVIPGQNDEKSSSESADGIKPTMLTFMEPELLETTEK